MSTENTPSHVVSAKAYAETPTQTSSNPLGLPEPTKDTAATVLDVSSGEGVKLNHLGPMIVNKDGTLSRIANWEHMTEIERRNTVRILGKRNQLRMDALKAEEEKGGAGK